MEFMEIRDVFSAIRKAFTDDAQVYETKITEILHEGGEPAGRVLIEFSVRNICDDEVGLEMQYRIYECVQSLGGVHYEAQWYDDVDKKDWHSEEWHCATFQEALELLADDFFGTGA